MKKRNLYILGAGSFGRELEGWLEDVPESERDWVLKGYLDDHAPVGSLDFPSDYEVLGKPTDVPLTKNDYVLVSVAHPQTRQKIYHALKDQVTFFTFVSPKALIGKFNVIGEGSVICPHVIVTTNVQLGKCTILNIGAQIGHDVRIDDFCSLMPNTDLGGFCQIGKRCFLGTNSTVIPERKIGDDVLIGAGAIVVRNFTKPHLTLVGNPARKLGS